MKKLREAGAVILGKANMTELANGMSSEMWAGYSSRGGQTLNPYGDPTLFVGGSSSGSAVAVVSNFSVLSVGTETDASILSSAIQNSVVGIKPTVGLISRSGIIPFTYSQDTAGPFARTVKDAAILLGVLTGIDKNDVATYKSEGRLKEDYTTYLDPKGLNGHLLEEPKKLFNYIGILDVYNCILTEQEASELLGFNQHNLKYGFRFLNTFCHLFHLEKEVYVHIYKKGLSNTEFKFILGSLNQNEANIFRKLFSMNKEIYKIGDEEALKFLVNLSVKELYFSSFFFPSLETVILGNWDLCFPVYSKKKDGFKKCKEIIERNQLFIRE